MSHASDVYGSGMTEAEARRLINGGRASSRDRASSPIRTYCYGTGLFPTKTPCTCNCHGDNGVSPCDVYVTPGTHCDGSTVS